METEAPALVGIQKELYDALCLFLRSERQRFMIIVRSPRNGLYTVLGHALLTRDLYRVESYVHFKDDTEKLTVALNNPRSRQNNPLCVEDIECKWGERPCAPSSAMTLALYNRTVCTDFNAMLQIARACVEPTAKLIFVMEAINLQFPPETDADQWRIFQTPVPTPIYATDGYPRPRSYDQLKKKAQKSEPSTGSLNTRGSTSAPLFLLTDLVSSDSSSNSSTGETDSTRV